MRAIPVLLLALAAGGCVAPPRSADPVYDPRYGRLALTLTPAERDFVLAEMRQFVHSIRGIVEGLGDNDMNAVAGAARAAGTQVDRARGAGPGSPAEGLSRKLPPEFRALGLATRAAFDEMALHAERVGDRDHLLASLGDNLRRCVACHSAYRFPE